jgi:hypothetical protein
MARVGDCQVAQQHHVAAPQPSLRCTRRGEQRVDLGREIPACLGAEAACVQAHLVDAARNAQARQPARHADRIERAQQLLGTVLGTLRARDPRHRAVAQQHAFGQSAALEHVEPVGQQRAGLVGLIALPTTQRPARDASMQVNGLRRPRSISARASVGRSSFSTSSTWPSHR